MYIYTYSPYSTLIALILFALICFCAYFHMTIFVIIRAHLKFLPFYNKLEKEYNAKYPTIMADIYGLQSFNIDERDDLETFFFVSDSSFHIVSSTRPDLHVELPFEAVLYHGCHIDIYSKYDYNYRIYLGILIDNNKILKVAFDTLEYNHRIDKKYGARLSGEELYSFIKENFIDEETYEQSPLCFSTSH